MRRTDSFQKQSEDQAPARKGRLEFYNRKEVSLVKDMRGLQKEHSPVSGMILAW
jgi:hypothetical protein